ncbi:hypothetical protein KP22_15870 [Pectobacterium betavasculorum]|uniref:Uncharacterized protein n=1 Tax=Pectobacterium betavasculorum TaxID=55207 RepID=A0A093S0E0_9GAMM|nr:hypothetical protein [Pectobacterium betavasculorum]KFX03551.1 hypothetical protein KP22_15870 [Pectobacterium betavasculorum]
MDHFLGLLKLAFNESASYFSWAFYSLITAYIVMALLDKNKVRGGVMSVIGIIIFLVYVLIFIPNLFFISQVFYERLGWLAGVLSFIVGFVMMMLNSIPVIYGITQKNDKKEIA